VVIGLIAHGLPSKAFIPNCSDIDLQLYLDDAAFSETAGFRSTCSSHPR
jgi:hypothetical protein